MKMWKQFLRMNSRQNVLNEHLGETGNDLNLMVELILYLVSKNTIIFH